MSQPTNKLPPNLLTPKMMDIANHPNDPWLLNLMKPILKRRPGVTSGLADSRGMFPTDDQAKKGK